MEFGMYIEKGNIQLTRSRSNVLVGPKEPSRIKKMTRSLTRFLMAE